MTEYGSLKRIRQSSPTPSECSSSVSELSYALSDFESRRVKGRPLRVAIEGNIAAGKSTFLNILYDLVEKHQTDENLKWYVQPEPLAKWTKSNDEKGGKNLLDSFYKEPNRWAYTFEAYTFVTRMQQAIDAEKIVQLDQLHENADSTAPVITFFERSVYSSRLVFAENSFESAYLDTTEWALYCDWSSYLLKTVKQLKLDAIIYLQCDPKVCGERMKIRSRNEEASVPQEYLNQLHEKYESWLNGWMKEKPVKVDKNEIHCTVKRALSDVPILILNCSEEFEHNPDRRNTLVNEVKDFLFEITSQDQSDFEEECHADNPNPLDMPLVPRDIFNTKLPSASTTVSPSKLKDKITIDDADLSDIENQTPSFHNIPKRFRNKLTSTRSSNHSTTAKN